MGIYDETKNDCIKNCAENNGGCVNQACNNGVCEDCAEGEYFNTAENSCKADPCDESACGGHQCLHNQGSVTCSCEDTSLIYDETKNDCIKNCAENNGGCVNQACNNGVCEDCAEGEYSILPASSLNSKKRSTDDLVRRWKTSPRKSSPVMPLSSSCPPPSLCASRLSPSIPLLDVSPS